MKIVSEQAFEAFESDVEKALKAAKLFNKVDIDLYWCAPEMQTAGHSVELYHVMATPMRRGYGTKAMEILIEVADRHGIDMVLKIEEDSDGIDSDYSDEDEETEAVLIDADTLADWFSRFGFEDADNVVGLDRILIRASQEPKLIPQM